jgi:hypothetical protein
MSMARKAATQVQSDEQTELDEPTSRPAESFAYDKVFFSKNDIHRGTKLRNYGRRDPGSIWTVTRIEHYVRTPSGGYRLVVRDEVEALADIIHMRRDLDDPAMQRTRTPSFGSLAYSAIWRIV